MVNSFDPRRLHHSIEFLSFDSICLFSQAFGLHCAIRRTGLGILSIRRFQGASQLRVISRSLLAAFPFLQGFGLQSIQLPPCEGPLLLPKPFAL